MKSSTALSPVKDLRVLLLGATTGHRKLSVNRTLSLLKCCAKGHLRTVDDLRNVLDLQSARR